MWIKLVIGAVAGLLVGHWVAPGYAVWTLIGIIIGALVEFLMKNNSETKSETE